MVSRFKPFLFLFLPFFLSLACSLQAAMGQDGDGPPDVRDTIGQDLSGKTDAELFTMEREIQKELAKDPGSADLYLRISTVYATLFDRTRTEKNKGAVDWLIKSRDALEKVLMIRPEDKTAHYNLGVVYKRIGQMERAREELKKAIRLSDPNQDAYLICTSWLQIGSVYEEQGFFEEAKEAYEKARELDYGNEDIQQAIRNVDAKRKSSDGSGGASFSGMPMGGPTYRDPQIAAAMGQDPNAQNANGMAQALPALGQALMQKFGGGGGGGEESSGQGQ